jgi:hypothetical protein
LIGATAIEDKLQEGVPRTIYNLRRAAIKVRGGGRRGKEGRGGGRRGVEEKKRGREEKKGATAKVSREPSTT